MDSAQNYTEGAREVSYQDEPFGKVKKPKHLTDDALLLLAGRRLAAEDERRVTQHLDECDSCRERFRNLKFAHIHFEQMARIGLSNVLGSIPEVERARPKREFAFPWGPVTAILFGCVCVLTVFFYPKAIPQASASELLADAMRSEGQLGLRTGFRVQVGGTACAAGKQSEQMVSFEKSLKCDPALQHVRATRWGRGNPLSAKTYAAWRDGLRERHDRVTKRDTMWDIQTTTDDGLVHSANLEMRVSDYHTTKLTLDFEDSEEISISESTEPVPAMSVADIGSGKVQPEVKYIDNPGDVLEVQAWQTLASLHADTGYEGSVFRDGPGVTVKVATERSRQQDLLSGFQQMPDVKLSMISDSDRDYKTVVVPRELIPINGDDEQRVEAWLGKQFPGNDAVNAYLNNADEFVRGIVGRAFFIEKLKERRRALAKCSCAKDLSELIAKEESIQTKEQMDLAYTLKPVIGTPRRPPSHPLSFEQAQNLDLAFQTLFKGVAIESDGSLDAQIQKVLQLL